MQKNPERWLVWLVALALGAATALGCRRRPPPPATQSSAHSAASASAFPSSTSAASAAPATSSARDEPAPAPCRAMRVTGTVRSASGRALSTQGALDGREWLEIGKQSELVVRHGASARELSLRGPGRFLPCRSGLEQVLLAEGSLRSSPGTGVRPGAEVWVATPFGAVRYADADLELAIDLRSLSLRVHNGQAFVEAAEGLGGPPGGRVAGPNGRVVLHGRSDTKALVSACERVARVAQDSAQRLLTAKPEELGQLAATQLRSRRLARGQCLVAEASAARVEDPSERSRLGDQLQRFEALWQGIPRAGR